MTNESVLEKKRRSGHSRLEGSILRVSGKKFAIDIGER